MKTYLLDIFTETNEVMLAKLLREAQSDSEDELGRLEWQIENSYRDILIGDLVSVAVFCPSMREIDRYEDGVAYYEGDGLVDKLYKLMVAAETGRKRFAGWGIKSYVVPFLYKVFLINGIDISILDKVFDLYPYENVNTIDLNNLYNFNGQMSTVRARNRYSLEETAYAYGEPTALDKIDTARTPEEILRDKIRLQEYLFDLRGLKWE